MTKTTFFPFIFHAGITVSLTCSLKKDSAGFGDLILHKGASRCQGGFFLRVSSYGRSLWEPFGVAGFPLCVGSPTRKLLPALFGDMPAILQFAQRRPSCLKQPYSLIQELTVTIFCQ